MTILKGRTLITMLLLGLVFVSCTNNDDEEELLGNWIKKSSFDGPARSSAASFVIGSYAYVATGYTGDEYLKDLWAYNSDGDYWEQKADFTGVARSSASGFSIEGNGYIGLGYDGTNKLKEDLTLYYVKHLIVCGNKLYFTNNYLNPIDEKFNELWQTDGTSDGTILTDFAQNSNWIGNIS